MQPLLLTPHILTRYDNNLPLLHPNSQEVCLLCFTVRLDVVANAGCQFGGYSSTSWPAISRSMSWCGWILRTAPVSVREEGKLPATPLYPPALHVLCAHDFYLPQLNFDTILLLQESQCLTHFRSLGLECSLETWFSYKLTLGQRLPQA